MKKKRIRMPILHEHCRGNLKRLPGSDGDYQCDRCDAIINVGTYSRANDGFMSKAGTFQADTSRGYGRTQRTAIDGGDFARRMFG